ncbi:hypothetical protein HALLA_05540 [Halostagnicola larsenii XH-48]|uniref:Uncharacterized protein n=1 Tax=Halostagnicola larsenii XH-48 TaxID=797299 RepID=W0JIJ3_9EURY|nr:hypothetical protein [Halostagnicola larsenii]AHF98423.1 hypothetical protein HALLA_05540 [Halostagnicola larsenii XH-48]
MVDISTSTERRDDVTFVSATVTNDRTTPQYVRLESTLTPVWPPRRNGVVVPEWDGSRWRGRLEPDSRRGIGFASPATATDDPIRIIDARRDDGRADIDARTVRSRLERWTPSKRTGTGL